ncbi:MAG: hypothetical protein JNK53_00510 [Phycisphaerae bacterium]|nr:hypothetical protein [Phycisphaerae bacterium]
MTGFPDDVRDRIARRAAEMLESGRETSVSLAIRQAAADLGARERAHFPTAALVRKHAGALALQSLGSQQYEARVLGHLKTAADAMQALEDSLDAATLLVGRAVRGQVDADAVLHIRVYTRASVARIAQALVESGLPEPTLHTIDTRYGRVNQLRCALSASVLVVQRCLPEWKSTADTDLVTGRAIPTQSLERLLARISPSRP